MFEIEIKAQLDDQISSEIFESATDLGFTVCWRGVEEDVYYNGNDRDFRQTDEALRIRTQRALAPAISTTTLITYKGPKAVGPTQSRTELETAVADDDVLRDILDHLGYPSVMTVRKTRVELDGEYPYEGYHICLDRVDELGDFIEIERVLPDEATEANKTAATEAIFALLALLGVPASDIVEETYLEMLLEQYHPAG